MVALFFSGTHNAAAFISRTLRKRQDLVVIQCDEEHELHLEHI